MSDTKDVTKLNTPVKYPFEPERYELTEPPRHRFGLQRRDFFKFVGGGVAILMSASGKALAQQETGGARRLRQFLRRSTPGCTSAKTIPSRYLPAKLSSARTRAPRSRNW